MINKKLIIDLINMGDREIIITCDYLRTIKKSTNNNKHLGQACLELAMMGNLNAMHTMSIIFSYGLMCKQNKEEALYWIIKSVNKKFYPSFLTLANFYSQEWANLKRDDKKSIELIKKAALNKFLPGITMLGICYKSGEQIVQDNRKAIKYLKEASNLGDEMAMWFLSAMILHKLKIKDQSEGIFWLKESAKNKCPFAHNTLAYFYLDGSHGLEKNKDLYNYHIDMELSLKKKLVSQSLERL